MKNVLKPTDVTQELVLGLKPGESIFVKCDGKDDVQRARMSARAAIDRNPHTAIEQAKVESYATADGVIMCRIDFIGRNDGGKEVTP